VILTTEEANNKLRNLKSLKTHINNYKPILNCTESHIQLFDHFYVLVALKRGVLHLNIDILF